MGLTARAPVQDPVVVAHPTALDRLVTSMAVLAVAAVDGEPTGDVGLGDTLAAAEVGAQHAGGRVDDLHAIGGVQRLHLGERAELARPQDLAAEHVADAAGDVLVELVVRPHPIFRREGDDLHMDLYVTVPDAVLGAKVDAPTPDGTVSLTVPKGSSSGSTLRLKGRGAATGAKRGDLFARILLALPDQAEPELEAFAERWRKERPYAPRRRS